MAILYIEVKLLTSRWRTKTIREVVLSLMKSPLRSRQIMSSEAFDALRRTKTVYLTTWSASGKSGTVPVWFFEHHGRIYFCSQRETLKVRRIRRSGRATVHIGRRSGPQLNCTAHIMDDAPEVRQLLLRTYRRRYWFRWLFLGPRIQRALSRDEEVIIELTPDVEQA
jgi:PPOX class probable F420-dependent enzyme